MSLMLVYAANSFGQTGELKGVVMDIDSVTPAEFMIIEVLLNDKQIKVSVADEKGNYWLRGIPVGTYDVRFSRSGFQTVVFPNVKISADDISFLSPYIKSGHELGEHVFTDKQIKLRPGITPGSTEYDIEVIQDMPQLTTVSVVNNMPGVYTRDGKFGSFSGSRQEATVFINGVKIRNASFTIPRMGAQSVQVFNGGIPAKYGDVVGGVIEITMRNIANKFFGSVEARTSQLLDDYGHYYFSGTMGGPLIKFKENDRNKARKLSGRTLLGFLLSFEGGYDKDAQPGFGGWYKATNSTLENIINNPLRLPPAGQSGTRYNAEYLGIDAFEKTAARLNAASQYFNANAKLDFAPAKNTFISMGGYLNASQNMIWDRNNSLFNWENNGMNQSLTWNLYGKFTQYFEGKRDEKGKQKGLKSAMISLQADYLNGYNQTQDVRHTNQFYNYGYVGKFNIYRQPTYQYGYDPVENKSGFLFTGYQDTLVSFTPSDINAQISGITSQFYSLYNDPEGHYDQLSSIMNNGGIINGSIPKSIYDLYNAPGTPFNGYMKADNSQFHFNFSGSAVIGNHDIGVGFDFEQRTDAYYQLSPVQLWTISRLLTNSHLGTIDTSNPSAVYDNNGNYNDTINYAALYVADPNRPGFGLGQTFFDYNLRLKLGLNPNSTQYINIDSLDPSFLDISMLSADELYNNGSSLVLNSGYDVYGNRTSNNASLEDFFMAKDMFGNYTRPVSAFQPIYMGGYIQDKFSFQDMVFNVGIRVDRYDANQQVLKDPYSLYDSRKVGDVNELNGEAVSHPGNAENDWVVYVNDVNDPTEILGYRDGDTWYNATGQVISDPTLLRNSSGRVQPFLVDPSTDVTKPGPGLFNAFTDYVPQINVMPRIAFTFRLGENSMFDAHFNMLTQRPTLFNGNRNLSQLNPMDYLFWDNTSYNSAGTFFNNPNLRPEKTTDFSVSFSQVIGGIIMLKARAFYREMRDMIAGVKYQEAYPRTYAAWSNIDFATSKGITTEIHLEPEGDNLSMIASYTLQFADGTGSSSFSQLNLINSGSPNLRSTIPLAFDSRHQFKLFASFNFGDNKTKLPNNKTNYIGPKGKFFEAIFRNLGMSLTMYGNSGVPYSRQVIPTPTQLMNGSSNGSLLGSLNGARLPFEFYSDMNITKEIPIFFKNKAGIKTQTRLQLYVNIQNLFNIQNILNVYGATGSPDDDGYLTAPNYQTQIAGQVDPASYGNYYSMKVDNPYNYSMPRRVKFGIALSF